ncbi:MepB family protein [Lactococcus lactis]|uniref:MepB family protein n=1 Tax=Lactococcus lactis TaxID=1358 RepID=UPI0024179C6F|nr:MepB family protein [Lactococcus lactis]MDG4957509.1 MepB family protein [Lactococcus lactis]
MNAFAKTNQIIKGLVKDFKIVKYEEQNIDYEGAILYDTQKGHLIRSRLGKLTPKKSGFFTVFWEQDIQGRNHPFCAQESPDFLLVAVYDENRKGIFLIPKAVTIDQKILSTNTQKGKMAMRFYPVWCQGLNPTAQKTQRWQLEYFIDLSDV